MYKLDAYNILFLDAFAFQYNIQTTKYDRYICLSGQVIPKHLCKIYLKSIDPEKELGFNIYYNLSSTLHV
jgi:hypothetical protein